MCNGGLLCAILCSALVLSHSSGEHDDFLQLLPRELRHEILCRMPLKNYFSVLQTSKGMLRDSRLPFKAELGVRRRYFVGKLVAHLARTYSGGALWARVREAEQRTRQTASGGLLKELMDEVFTALEKVQNWRAIRACCDALVTDKRLDVGAWRAYADAVMNDVVDRAVLKDVASKRLQVMLRRAARRGSIKVVKAIVSSAERENFKINLAAGDNYAIRQAAANGHVEILQLLLAKKEGDVGNKYGYQSIDPAADDNYAIELASKRGHVEVIELLLAKKEERPELYGGIDPTANDNYTIGLAAKHGHAEIVRLLLAKKEEHPELYRDIDPAAHDNYAIKGASRGGHDEVVVLLLAKREENPELYGNIDSAAADGHELRWALPRRLRGAISRLNAKTKEFVNQRAESILCTIM